jgi:acetyl-CoA carboxylase/biotin carboxylase 1
VGNKPDQLFLRCINVLNDILDGFDNQAVMTSTLKDLIGVLHDPELPYSEATAILSTLSEHLPARLKDSIRVAIDTKGIRQEFPAVLLYVSRGSLNIICRIMFFPETEQCSARNRVR